MARSSCSEYAGTITQMQKCSPYHENTTANELSNFEVRRSSKANSDPTHLKTTRLEKFNRFLLPVLNTSKIQPGPNITRAGQLLEFFLYKNLQQPERLRNTQRAPTETLFGESRRSSCLVISVAINLKAGCTMLHMAVFEAES